MRAYSERDEENLRARSFLTDWRKEGLLSLEQYQQLESETVSELRTTNIFLRLALLFFTLLAIATAVGLFFLLMGVHSTGPATGVCLVVFAGMSYFAAETVVSQAHHYRHGIEEAFSVAAVGLLCMGTGEFFLTRYSVQSEHHALLLIGIVGMLSSLWIWYRFGLPYAFPAAMVFVAVGVSEWTLLLVAQRLLLCMLYGALLGGVATVGANHRFDYLKQRYSLAEAFLWFGIYLTLNLKLSAISSPAELWSTTLHPSGFPAPFYWTTWVLLWCLPPLILTRAARGKDRFVLAVGMITSVLTLVTNKPYLGWQRHTWDPMLLGIALIAVAMFLLRWLARGPGGVRHGFTAANMSSKDKHTLGVASSVLGFVSPHSLTPTPQAQPTNANFESGFGGSSGGAGASGDF